MKKNTFFVWLLIVSAVTTGLYYAGYIPKEYLGMSNEDTSLASNEQKNIYLPLDPPFVVNFTHQGTLRYLQISLEVMYRNQVIIDAIEEQMPAVRNDLILLFSDQQYEKLSSHQGKQTLRQEILTAINGQIRLNEDAPDKGEVYITNFVMQ